jgi:hypothetical protein
MCEKQNMNINPSASQPYDLGHNSRGNPVVAATGEVLAGEYRPNAGQRLEQAKERMRIHDGEQPQANINRGTSRTPTGSERVIAEAYRELQNQCSAMPLTEHAVRVIKESVHQQVRIQQATEYLDLATHFPEVARMIELARGGLF